MIEKAEERLMANLLKRLADSRKKHPRSARGQSLVELAIVLALLLFMVIAIVEYGFLLNQYLDILDGGREAARQASLADPFLPNGNIDPNFFVRPNLSQPVSATNPPGVADLVEDYLDPIVLDPTRDDVVVSFFSVSGGSAVRFPDADGWSRYGNSTSQFSTSDVEARLNGSAPATGVLLIEIFYNYWQTMNLPIFSNVIPNPIPLYTFAIMPLSAAEPTPTPMP
jgi:hypothetical protein